MGSLYQLILYHNLFLSLSFFASVSIYFSPLFSFITTFYYRLRRGNAPLNKNLGFKEDYQKEPDVLETEQLLDSDAEAFKDVSEFPDSENDEEIEKNEFSFTFKFPTYEEFCRSKQEKGELFSSELKPSTCNDESLIEPEVSCSSHANEELLDKDCFTCHSGPSLMESELVEPVDFRYRQVKSEKPLTETEVVEIEDLKEVDSKDEVANEEEKGNLGNLKCDEEEIEESSCTDSDTVSIGFEHMHYLMSKLVDSYSDEGFMTDEDFGDNEKFNVFRMTEENQESDDNDSDILEELRKLEHDHEQRFLSEDDFQEDLDKLFNDTRSANANKLESLWEHQELVEQLKVELRKVRDIGLPTILEESECLKMEDLKPWKIEEKFQREDCMSELHKFYKSYKERMRKFDILTYQKLYAIGVLQKDPLKDPFQHVSVQSSSGPKLKSLISQNIRLFKHKSHESIDPMVKFIKELQSDLEVIYVGQLCLSWEFLHWQYMKALNLWESDPRGICTYNEVAGEFQQFQVLLQRFIENEPFEGPRIQYYIKSRYDLRNLLQIPVIREDKMEVKSKARARECDFSITSDMLVDIMEESIRIFWRFVRADRCCSSLKVKGRTGKHQELQSQGDLELLMEVKKTLEKKEKKLKEALRSECCILRRFKKYKEDDSDHVLYFFSQVDMKLVIRVLNMSKLTTDQLVWCHNKLNRISFVHRKIHVDPSFLLFPC